MTDSGDRDHTTKADTTEDKKWLNNHAKKVLTLLEEVLSAYK